MKREEYINKLKSELSKHDELIVERIKKIINLIPDKATELTIDICPGQDNDGYFEIHSGLNGPDLYVLNKVIEDVAYIFEVRHGSQGYEPAIPSVDPNCIDWDLYLTLCETVMNWLKDLWNENAIKSKIPTTLIIADDFDEFEPVELN